MRSGVLTVVFAATMLVSQTTWADDVNAPASGPGTQIIDPIDLNPILASDEGFKPLPPWPKEMVLSGSKSHSSRPIFSREISVGMYKGTDELIKEDSHWVDEFVYLIHGDAILTPDGGKPHHFKAGDFFLVPKGFKGTWETRNGYKELVVVEASANDAAKKSLGR
jgi:uncharacterized cupin superfamily protein